MINQNIIETIKAKFKPNSTQSKVFDLLSDQNWHCRECEGKKIASAQYAGGGGIQGLQRGTKNRPGLVIESEKKYCPNCQSEKLGDRWTGEIKSANASANFPPSLITQILTFYHYTDIIEQRQRPRHELIIDHRFPMERWGELEPKLPPIMTESDIKKKFQLLKKDASGNHNLLKSRSCEKCIKTGKRGTPFGIKFWYEGGENWAISSQKGAEAELGCIGCGWYDFETWRESLNQYLTS